MRRPPPYLALAAAVVLVTLAAGACPGEARGGGDEPVFQSINGWPIYPGSTSCPVYGTAAYVPTEARVQQIRQAVFLFISTDLETGALTTPLLYMEWRAAMAAVQEYRPRFQRRPVYVMAQVPPGYTSNCQNAQGEPRLCTCAAGVGYLSPLVAVDNPSRTEALVAWETVNGFLGVLRRGDLFDGPYVTSVNNRASALVGGWRTQ